MQDMGIATLIALLYPANRAYTDLCLSIAHFLIVLKEHQKYITPERAGRNGPTPAMGVDGVRNIVRSLHGFLSIRGRRLRREKRHPVLLARPTTIGWW
jgi:hypothetical protein